jgi:hypothetical protein
VVNIPIVVDLPAPFGPSRPKNSPAATCRLMPRTAGTSPREVVSVLRRSSQPGYSPSPARVLEKLVTPFFSVTKYSQLPAAGCSAASIAALPGLSIGPGGSPLCR